MLSILGQILRIKPDKPKENKADVNALYVSLNFDLMAPQHTMSKSEYEKLESTLSKIFKKAGCNIDRSIRPIRLSSMGKQTSLGQVVLKQVNLHCLLPKPDKIDDDSCIELYGNLYKLAKDTHNVLHNYTHTFNGNERTMLISDNFTIKITPAINKDTFCIIKYHNDKGVIHSAIDGKDIPHFIIERIGRVLR